MTKQATTTSVFRNQRGVGLIEVMVALMLGTMVVAAVAQVFVGTKTGYRMEEGLSRLQENGRLAMEFPSYDIRLAGYTGCSSLDQITPNSILDPTFYPGFTYDASVAVSGHQYNGSGWTPALPAVLSGLASPPLANTDVVRAQMGSSCDAYLTGNMGAANANIQITVPNSCNFVAGDALLITDCADADLFAATAVSASGTIETIAHASNLNTTNFLSKAYGPDAEVMRFESVSYYIANGVNGGPSLWRLNHDRAVGGNNPQELVEGVENLQVLYGEDTDADRYAETYVSASAVTDWANVVSVRLALLVDSIEISNTALDTATYDLLGTVIDPVDDRLLRKVFRGTVSLRNRLP